MNTQLQTNECQISTLQTLIVVGVLSAITLGVLDAVYDFGKLWDFRVYLKARTAFFETGNPYFDAESLRFIYPPSATFVFYFINDSAFFKSVVFVLNGTLWVMTACFFCRSKYDLAVVIPALLFLFGMQGWVAILTGNIACLLYFSAALAGLLYYNQILSTIMFAALVLLLTLIKPFYAEFLIFVWFVRGFKSFLVASLAVVSAFFAINLTIYPELFQAFLNALKVNSYDTEIYGITFFSNLSSLGFNSFIAAIMHLSLIGFMFVLFVLRLPYLNRSQQYGCLFILAVFINPKHITYDLMVAVPALVVLLLQTRSKVLMMGAAILILASVLDFTTEGKPYFQWWYAFVGTYILVLFDGRYEMSNFWKRVFTPNEAIGVK